MRTSTSFLRNMAIVLPVVALLPAAAEGSSAASSTSTSTSMSMSTSIIPFDYSEKDLNDCACELKSAAGEKEQSANTRTRTSTRTCVSLYQDFLDHYNRGGKRGEDLLPLSTSTGYFHFTKTVRLVHQHNHEYNTPNDEHDEPRRSHKLRLNQFADTSRSYSKRDAYHNKAAHRQHQQARDEDEEDISEHHNNKWQVDLENFWEVHRHNEEEDDPQITGEEDNASTNHHHRRSRKLRWAGTGVRLLGTSSSVRAENEHQQQQQQQQQQQTHLRQSQQQQQKKEHNTISRRSLLQEYEERTPLSSELRIVSGARHNTMVIMPGDGTDTPTRFSSPQVPDVLMGTEAELHKGTKLDAATTGNGNAHRNKFSESLDSTTGNGNAHRNKFSESLDWSTDQNPDGVPLVHSVYDQGSCGSCWAFAATGSVEASAARNFARNYFVKGLVELEKKRGGDRADDDDYFDEKDDDENNVGGTTTTSHRGKYLTLIYELIEDSMRIEAEVFERLNLSIQELLDCDNSVDEGCVGGNPLLAFYFIHKHGLVPWQEYPYEGYRRSELSQIITTTGLGYKDDTFPIVIESPETEKNEEFHHNTLFQHVHAASKNEDQQQPQELTVNSPFCHNDKIKNPIATVESWGLLHKDHEDLIQDALLYVGPVAVGINGADPSFINYGGGIFDSADCDQAANHALLIVGYDQEDVARPNGEVETVRYWIARNSWGVGWGENGFVRVKRGSGGKGVPGVCGIARSPSVALGGVYRQNRTKPLKNRDTLKTTSRYRKGKYVASYDTSASREIENRRNHPGCYSTKFSAKNEYLSNDCVQFSIVYERNQPLFLALICMLFALIAIIPLAVSLFRQHRVAVGSGSLRLDYYHDDQSPHYGSSVSSSFREAAATTTPSGERTHLLTLKDMYADKRKREEETKRPRGRSIVMTSSEQDPFRLEPSLTFD